jgi:hypothetical protein
MQTTSRYRILDPIGRGRIGEIHLAEAIDPEVKPRQVAVAMMDPRLTEHEPSFQALQEQVEILEQLQHPNIARTLELAWFLEGWGLVMEYARGLDLELYRIAGAMPVRVVAEVVEQVCSALGAALELPLPGEEQPLGLSHGDLVPSLVRLDADGAIKVCAFGLAAADGPDPLFAAPEQRQGQAGPAADVYSLGLMMARLLSGMDFPRPPADPSAHREFVSTLIEACSAKVHEETPTASRQAVEPVLLMLESMLSFEPARRPTARRIQMGCRSMLGVLPGPWLQAWAQERVPQYYEKAVEFARTRDPAAVVMPSDAARTIDPVPFADQEEPEVHPFFMDGLLDDELGDDEPPDVGPAAIAMPVSHEEPDDEEPTGEDDEEPTNEQEEARSEPLEDDEVEIAEEPSEELEAPVLEEEEPSQEEPSEELEEPSEELSEELEAPAVEVEIAEEPSEELEAPGFEEEPSQEEPSDELEAPGLEEEPSQEEPSEELEAPAVEVEIAEEPSEELSQEPSSVEEDPSQEEHDEERRLGPATLAIPSEPTGASDPEPLVDADIDPLDDEDIEDVSEHLIEESVGVIGQIDPDEPSPSESEAAPSGAPVSDPRELLEKKQAERRATPPPALAQKKPEKKGSPIPWWVFLFFLLAILGVVALYMSGLLGESRIDTPPARPAPEAPVEAAPPAVEPPAPDPEPPVAPATGPEDAVDPRPEAEAAPTPTPTSAPQPAAAPRPAPQPAPKPAPQPAPQPAPKPEPKPAPKPEPQPAPKPEPQPAPKPEPQPAPEPAPAPKPAPTSGGGTVSLQGDATKVRLQSDQGSFPLGSVPAGTYSISAWFGGDAPVPAGTVTVAEGEQVTLRCSSLMLRCSRD